MPRVPELEVLGPLRTVIKAESGITSLLSTWQSEPSIFTKRPVPDSIGYPVIIVGPVVSGRSGVADGINDHRPVVTVDVSVYGLQDDHIRIVETLGQKVFSLFHQQRNVTIANYSVTQILAEGPYPAPVDDEQTVARRVRLNLRLRAQFQ